MRIGEDDRGEKVGELVTTNGVVELEIVSLSKVGWGTEEQYRRE